MRHSFWNVTKHRLDVKTSHVQKFKTDIPNNNLGAKSIDRMIMIIFSEAHRGSLMFTHGTEERLNKDTSLESFRNHINTKMTFREALNKTCALLRKRISHVELSHKRQKKSHLLRSDAEYTDSVVRETCLSPKHNAFDNLTSNPNMSSAVIDRFKYCKGKPVCRVSHIDYTRSGARAKGVCIGNTS